MLTLDNFREAAIANMNVLAGIYPGWSIVRANDGSGYDLIAGDCTNDKTLTAYIGGRHRPATFVEFIAAE